MKRREFIEKTVLSTVAAVSAPSLFAGEMSSRKQRLTILHTNDTHSNIDPFPSNHAKFPGMGGVAKRYDMISQIRREEEQVLVLDAGDIFQGTPYFNRFGGELEMKVMTKIGYDAATMGNHDFDAGMAGFLKAKQYAGFPFLCANYDFKNTLLDGQTRETAIFRKGGLKIGVFGVGVELKGLVPDKLFGETVYLDPLERAQDMVTKLEEANCDLIICLSHLGYEYPNDKVSDRVLAKKTRGIDLIIGGHTHTFLEKPTQELNLDGKITLINQVGWAGLNLGRIDFDVEKKYFTRKEVIEIK
ncbi:MAG: bifunctional metallophosphatase/5'-nucleotidase [Bacteroidota bacterium]